MTQKIEDLNPTRCGVELGMARGMEDLNGSIILRVNGRKYSLARKDARALGRR